MWRSGMFWQFFLLSGGLVLLALLAVGLLFGIADLDDVRFHIWPAVGLIAVAGVAAAFVLTRRLIAPLHELAHGARKIAAGEYGRKVFAEGSDEVGILAQSFNYTSERLAAQFAQLDEDRQQLRAVLGSMVEGVIAVDALQNVLFANERAVHLLDFDSRQAVGRHLLEIVRQRDLHEAVNSVLKEKRGQFREFSWRGPSPRSLSVHASPLPGDPPRGVVLVLHDTTELRKLERVRQEFVANVSHELKTPLSVIKANVETLLDGAIDDRDHCQLFLQRIEEQANRLNSLIHDLLSLARIESEVESYLYQMVAVDEIVETCIQRGETLIEEKQQKLEYNRPGEDVFVWADEEAVLQIVDNLVDNAVKYTPEGGRITIGWWTEEDWTVIEVKDTGLGVPEKELPRIFERFYRVDKARSRQLGGTGLGLAIVKHLVQAMKGSVAASSVVGQGSVFSVRLPRPAADFTISRRDLHKSQIT